MNQSKQKTDNADAIKESAGRCQLHDEADKYFFTNKENRPDRGAFGGTIGNACFTFKIRERIHRIFFQKPLYFLAV